VAGPIATSARAAPSVSVSGNEVAGFPVQPAMLGGRDLMGRARDQRGQVLAGEPTNLDAKARSLRVELCQSARPPAAASKCCIRRRTVVDVCPRLGSLRLCP
jgi:hypothetical protein